MRHRVLTITLLIIFFFPSLVFANEIEISSPSAILIDSKTGQILYEKNSNDKLYPASTTKIMTALLLLEEGDLDKEIKINDDVPDLIEVGSSQIYLIPGEILTRKQLLFALLIDSANDAGVAIAQDISGSVEKFSDLMNKKAKELGALNTNFVNPHGLHDDNHYTTASDLSIIAMEAMKYPIFKEAVTTERYIIPATEKQDTRYLYLTNRLVRKTKYKNFYYEHSTGIKTGYTTIAKSSLVGSASKNGLDLITVVLNSDSNDVYKDTHTLLDYGFENFQRNMAIKERDLVKEINIEANNEKLSLLAKEGFEYCNFKKGDKEIVQTINLPEEVNLPIDKDQELGSLIFTLDGKEIGIIPLISDREIEAPKPIFKLFTNLNIAYISGGIVALFLLYRTYIYMIKKRRRKRRMFRMR